MYAHALRRSAAAEPSSAKPGQTPVGRGAPAGAPAYLGRGVQMQAEAVQAWDCSEYDKPTCVQAAPDDAVVQTWDCSEYDKPTCVQQEAVEEDVQAKCDTCDEPVQQDVQAKCDTCEEPVQASCATCTDEEAPDQRERGKPKNLGGAKLGGVQAKAAPSSRSVGPAAVHRAARTGLDGANNSLPHGDRIQTAFGRHDVSDVSTRVGGAAASASRSMGALAFTSGRKIAFRGPPDLRLAAHEAAHVVQQRAGLALPDQVGRPGDPWERHADAVASAVVSGRSAEPLLDAVAPAGIGATPEAAPAVQRAITSMPSHLQEDPPVLSPAPSAAQPAPPEGGEGEVAESAAPEPEAATAAAQETSPPAAPEGVEVGPAPQEGKGGSASCYTEPRKQPPAGTKDPKADEKASKLEEEDKVTFDAWPDTPDKCVAQAAAAQKAGAVPAEVAPAESVGAAAPAEGSAEPAAPEGGADPVARAGESASEGAEGGGAPAPADPMAATIGGALATRDAAVADHDVATAELGGLASAVPALSKGVSLSNAGESAVEADRRRVSEERIAEFFARAAAQVEQALGFVASEVPARLGGMAEAAKANIQGAMEAEKSSISARVAQARELAFAQAGMAREQVTAAWLSTTEQVEIETATAISTLDAVHDTSVASVESGEANGLADVNSRFQTGRENHEAKGPEYATLALAKGQTYVDKYEKCKKGYADDGFWDGCLTVRRARAQQDAACKAAAGAEKGFLKAANKKGFDLLPLRGQYRCAVITGASQTAETLDKTRDQLVSGLETGRTATIGGLASSHEATLRAIDAALAGTLSALATQEHTQRQAVNDTGYLKQLAIDELAHTSAAGLARGVSAAVTSLQGTLDGLREQMTSGAAPDPETLGAALAAAEAGLGGGMGTLLDKMNEGALDAEARLGELASVTLEALTGITSSNDEQSVATESAASAQMSGLMEGALASFKEIGGGHVEKAKQSATEGTTSMNTAVAGFAEALSGIGAKIEEALKSSLDQLGTDLDRKLKHLDTQIPDEAQTAAEAEQPAWKSVVAIVLVILVIIAATVISIVTLGAGASLFAMIVVGALVGAASAALIQIISNWGAGKPWHEGVAQAAIMGAIGGALGALGGAAGGAIASGIANAGGTVVRQVVVTVGADLVSEGLTQVVGYVVFGQEFNWEGFVTAGVMSGVSFRPGARPGMPDVPRPSTGARAAITQVAGGAGAGFLTEAGLALVSGREFNLNNAFSAAASGGASARASRRGGTAAPPAETPRTGWRGRLDSFRSFDPGGVGERFNTRMEAVGGRISGVKPAGDARTQTPEAPHTRTDEPTTRTDETTTRTDEPTTRTKEPTTRTDEPTTRMDEPTTRTDEPTTRTDEPTTRIEDELVRTELESRIGDEPHTFHFEEVGSQIRCTVCSSSCGLITSKLDLALEKKNIPPSVRMTLEELRQRVATLEADIAAGRHNSPAIIRETNSIIGEMGAIAKTYPVLGEALNVDASAPNASIRQAIADEWAVRPDGTFDPNGTMMGHTHASVEAEALQRLNNGEAPDPSRMSYPVFRRLRHLAKSRAAKRAPMGMKKWCESGFHANAGRALSAPVELHAVMMLGGTLNNAAGQRLEYPPLNEPPHTEYTDKKGRKVLATTPGAIARTIRTRPDGTRPNATGGTDIIEHKHLLGDTTVLHDDQQLRAQREMAESARGSHELVVSSDRPLVSGMPPVRVSKTVGEASTVYYMDTASGQVTHYWSELSGGWLEIPTLPLALQNPASGPQLRKQLASAQQGADLTSGGGHVIAGSGSSRPLRSEARLIAQYGGSPGDWQRVVSTHHRDQDGSIIQVYAYRNVVTGEVVEMSTRIQ